MKQISMGEIWIWLSPQEKRFVIELIKPEYPTLHLGTLALMSVNNVLGAISKHHRVDTPMPGTHTLGVDLNVHSMVQWLPGNIMQIWMKLYDLRRIPKDDRINHA